jgi:mannosyl-oligosaccharide alpha-1,3-glucosidase
LKDKHLESKNVATTGELTWSYLKSMHDIRIERIIMVGIPPKYTGDTVSVNQNGKTWETTVTTSPSHIIIRDPKVAIAEDWEIHF